jgi:hypothetical protein
MTRCAIALLLAAAGCSQKLYYLDLPDVNLEKPSDLEARLAAFRSGEEPWHADPKQVADRAIRRHLKVPWLPDPFKPDLYRHLRSEEWGDYITRGYTYPSGAVMRYRVKIRPYGEIWYPIQVSHYKIVPYEHPAMDDDLPPSVQ